MSGGSSWARGALLCAALCLVCAPAGAEEPAPTVKTGFMVLNAPEYADVFLDDGSIGKTPLIGAYPATIGEHRIKFVRIGYAPFEETFKVFPGRVVNLLVEMTPVAGVLRLTAANVERARVFIDGKFAGDTPLDVELLTGPHAVKVTRAGYKDEVFNVTAVPGQSTERELRLEEQEVRLSLRKQLAPRQTRWYNRWYVWTGVVLGAAAVATAIVVPTLFSSRSPCQRLDVESCVPIHSALQTPSLTLGVSF